MDSYDLTLALVGLALFGAAWLPHLLHKYPLSLPIVYLGFGLLVFSLPLGLEIPNPREHKELVERLTELVVIISLMSAGIKLDRPVGWKRWASTWRLLAVTMPLSIAALALFGWWALGLVPASAILLGAVLAPTDPVLASDVQVGPPREGEEDEIRFAITSEAGLNDGLAFPFTNLAVAVALVGLAPQNWLGEWLLVDVLYKVGVGTLAGLGMGYLLTHLVFRFPSETKLAKVGDGFVAVAVTLLVYGFTELVHGYGFLAVFVAAATLRHHERSHDYHERLHDFSEQIERLLMVTILVLFGGAIAGGLLSSLTWTGAALGLAFIFLIRPLAGIIGLAGFKSPLSERLAISFFGIRGLGSFYYLAYAINHADFSQTDVLWAVTGFIVTVSILLHGVSSLPVMQYLDRKRNVRSPQRKLEESA